MNPGDLLIGAAIGLASVAIVLGLEVAVAFIGRDRRQPAVKMRQVHGQSRDKVEKT
jgi:hypothetical protein